MSSDATDTGAARDSGPGDGTPETDRVAELEARIETLEARLAEAEAGAGADDGDREMVIIATKGTLDMA